MVSFKKNFDPKFSKNAKDNADDDFSFSSYEENLGDVPPQEAFSEENFIQDDDLTIEQPPVFEENNFEEQPPKQFNLKKILILSLLFLILAIFGGAYFYVSNIDWNQHKDKLAAEFSEITGKRIIFNGPVHLDIFPSPKLTAENIKIFNPGEDLDDPLAEIKSLSTDLTLSSLINGDFDVKMMSVNGATIHFDLSADNKLNWDYPLTDAQKRGLENTQITLDSVLFRDAKIHFTQKEKKIDAWINDVNAEVIAQSLLGPYRIEGTYIKNNSPEGFAFSIGKVTEGLATSVNMVINQPSTETYVRFDGSVMPQNNAINGNFIFESKKLVDFVNSNSEKIKLKKEYAYPLALTFEVKSNNAKVEFTNFVLKYGETAGAGNLLIPLPNQNSNDRIRAELSFKFANLDLTPLSVLAQDLWLKYKDGKTTYNPQLKFDLLADFEAIKTTYLNQSLKDFKLSFDLIQNKLVLRECKSVLPGDANFSLTGEVYSELDNLTFNLKPSFSTDEFRQTLTWLNINLKNKNDLYWRRIKFNANLMGNANKVAISDINFMLDKSSFKGNLALIRDKNKKLLVQIENNSFNIKDYFPDYVQNLQGKNWNDKWNTYFQSIKNVSDLYAEIALKSKTLFIDDNVLEDISFNAKLDKNILTINQLDIEKFNENKVSISGRLKGFGQKAEFENIKYSLQTKDVNAFFDKLPMQKPNWNYSQVKNLNASGIITGYPNHFATKSVLNFDNFNVVYTGQFLQRNNLWEMQRGKIELQSPDFLKFTNALNFQYEPKGYILGAFSLSSDIEGSFNNLALNSLEANVGPNLFKGNLEITDLEARKKIYTNLTINRFELDKFFYNNVAVKSQNTNFASNSSQNADFLIQPVFSVDKLNFDFLKSFDIDGSFEVALLSYHKHDFKNAKFQVISNGENFQFKDFSSEYDNASFSTNFSINLLSNPAHIEGVYILNGFKLYSNLLHGNKVGISQGVLNLEGNFSANLDSYDDMFKSLKSTSKFRIADANVMGWNFEAILNDLKARQVSEGLSAFMLKNLQNKEAKFSEIEGSIQVDNGNFSIDETKFNIDNMDLTLTAKGNLQNWTMDSSFKAKYINPDYLPEFGYSYTGSLTTPVLKVQVNELASMYNRRQAEFEKERQQKIQAEKDALNKKLKDLLVTTDSVEKDVRSFKENDLKSRQKQAQTDEAKQGYEKIGENIKQIETDIAKIRLLAESPDITESNLSEISKINSKAQKDIKEMADELIRLSLNNLDDILQKNYEEVKNLKQQFNALLKQIDPKMKEFYAKLNSISSHYVIEADVAYLNLKKQFEEEKNIFESLLDSADKDFLNSQDKRNETGLLQASQNIKNYVLKLKESLDKLQSDLNKIFDYLNTRTAIEQENYEKKKREEEIKRKLEENTGSISIKGTGVSKTVTRDIQEIEESEKNIEDNKAQLLRFDDKPQPQVKVEENVIKKSSSTSKIIKKEGSSFLKKSDGKISKASGVIIKK